MRAALYDSYGPPDVLYEGRVPKPVAGPDDVLVRVHATTVNGGELLGRAGKVKLVTGAWDRGFPEARRHRLRGRGRRHRGRRDHLPPR